MHMLKINDKIIKSTGFLKAMKKISRRLQNQTEPEGASVQMKRGHNYRHNRT